MDKIQNRQYSCVEIILNALQHGFFNDVVSVFLYCSMNSSSKTLTPVMCDHLPSITLFPLPWIY